MNGRLGGSVTRDAMTLLNRHVTEPVPRPNRGVEETTVTAVSQMRGRATSALQVKKKIMIIKYNSLDIGFLRI